MAGVNKKVSEYDPLSSGFYGNNYVLVVDMSTGTARSRKQTLADFFSTIETDIDVTGNLTVSGDVTINGNTEMSVASINEATIQSLSVANGIIQTDFYTPGSSEGVGVPVGKFWVDADYLYVKSANNVVKRVALAAW